MRNKKGEKQRGKKTHGKKTHGKKKSGGDKAAGKGHGRYEVCVAGSRVLTQHSQQPTHLSKCMHVCAWPCLALSFSTVSLATAALKRRKHTPFATVSLATATLKRPQPVLAFGYKCPNARVLVICNRVTCNRESSIFRCFNFGSTAGLLTFPNARTRRCRNGRARCTFHWPSRLSVRTRLKNVKC